MAAIASRRISDFSDKDTINVVDIDLDQRKSLLDVDDENDITSSFHEQKQHEGSDVNNSERDDMEGQSIYRSRNIISGEAAEHKNLWKDFLRFLFLGLPRFIFHHFEL